LMQIRDEYNNTDERVLSNSIFLWSQNMRGLRFSIALNSPSLYPQSNDFISQIYQGRSAAGNTST
jgi:hypothetical protein